MAEIIKAFKLLMEKHLKIRPAGEQRRHRTTFNVAFRKMVDVSG
jgi:hypothetical protein